MYIVKRDGSTQNFMPEKIVEAVVKAFQHAGSANGRTSGEEIADKIFTISSNSVKDAPTVEKIQDEVERLLMGHDPDVAKAYILYRAEHNKMREVDPNPRAVADFIHAILAAH